MDYLNTILHGDSLERLRDLPSEIVDCCITSPPYWSLRDYKTEGIIWDSANECVHEWGDDIYHSRYKSGSHSKRSTLGARFAQDEARKHNPTNFCVKCNAWKGSLGLEPTFDLYIKHLVEIFAEVKRTLKKTGSLWVNLGDTYAAGSRGKSESDAARGKDANTGTRNVPPIQATPNRMGCGLPEKSLCLIPQRFQIAMVDSGWICRNTIIWEKGNPMPSSATDRFTIDFEYLFFFTKSPRYYFETQYEPLKTDPQPSKRRPGSKNLDESKGQKAHSFHRPDSDYAYNPLGRIKRSVWHINTRPFKEAHFACISEDTEIWTKTGWKNIDTITIDDQILTFDTSTQQLHYHNPYGIYRYNYSGELVNIKNGYIDQLVTPNHRVLLKYVHSAEQRMIEKEWRYVHAEDIKPFSGIRFPLSGWFKDIQSSSFSDSFVELLGWVITEGYYNKARGAIQIYQSITANPSKVARIRKCIERCNIPFSYKERTRPYEYKKMQQAMSYEAIFYIPREYAKTIQNIMPDKKLTLQLITSLPLSQLEILYETLLAGDGHTRTDGRASWIQYDSEQLDLFRILCLKIGKRTFLGAREDCVYVTHRNDCQIHQSDFQECYSKVRYDGRVWCPTLPNSNFVAKRNGKIFVTGNTFPPDLVLTPLKATCPEFVCNKCGIGRKIVYEEKRVNTRPGNDTGNTKSGSIDDPNMGLHRSDLSKYRQQIIRYPKFGGTKAPGYENPTYSGKEWNPVVNRMPIEMTDCGCNKGFSGGIVLDPFMGAGTTALVAIQNNRRFIGIELSKNYIDMAMKRLEPYLGQTRLA